ncbi:hypothetical protein GGS20DRAFT_564165, partial [Poronia punctata]
MAISSAVKEAFVSHVKLLQSESAGALDPEASFYVGDMDDVVRKWDTLKKALPDVTPFYAVKSNNDKGLIKTLASCGSGFDCASPYEVDLVLSLDIPVKRIIFTHPCKPASFIEHCRKRGVRLITFDNEDELRKIHQHYPRCHLMLRVFADDPTNADPLGTKFGACRDDFRRIVGLVKELGMNLAGASFHAAPCVAVSSKGYIKAIKDAAEVFHHAREIGLNPTILDMGGGYTDATFEEIAAGVKASGAIPDGVERLLAEPGTLFSSRPFFLAVKVMAIRKNAATFGNEPPTRLYINDGIYSSFNNKLFVSWSYTPVGVVLENGEWHDSGHEGPFKCSLWGRTCDLNDCINKECALDREVNVGDWLVFKDMGAYSTVCNTAFNGFTNPNHTIYVGPSEENTRKADFEPLRL